MVKALAVLCLFSSHSFAQVVERFQTPTKQLPVSQFPIFGDDLDLDGFELAAQRQIDLFKRRDMSGTITLGGVAYPLTKAQDSLVAFLDLADDFRQCRAAKPRDYCFDRFNQQMRAMYNVFVPDLMPGDPRYGGPQDTLFTGYATHPIHGRMKPDARFKYPIYAMPTDSSRVSTRQEIDFRGALGGKGLELVYGENLFEHYLLHVEGSGYVTVPDGSGGTKSFYLHYAGTNSQRWEFISLYMERMGYINNRSMGAQRKFLRQHPEKHEEIFSQCPSYVYFAVSKNPPNGMQGIPVTPGRSVATDRKLYPFKGLLTYVDSSRAVDSGVYDLEEEDRTRIPFQPFSRFFIDQDTGGAIVGKGRADIYFGIDDYAQYAATYQAEFGNIYFLLLK